MAPADAAQLSTALLDEFSSIGRVFSETSEAIERVVGVASPVPALLQAAHDACVESLSSEIRLRPIREVGEKLIEYLAMTMGSLSTEKLRILFLDRQRRLVGDEILASGSVRNLTAYPRTIFKRSLELSADRLIVVHNHPGGTPEPSKCDIDFTARLSALGKELEIEITDHIIIAGTRWFSFARQGLL